MEKSNWARMRKLDTAKTDLKPSQDDPGGQGVHREMESEGHEENYRAVIKGAIPMMNRSAKGETRSSPHYGGEGVLIHSPHQGVCGRHGREDRCVTPGGLTWFSGGTEISRPISRKMKWKEKSCEESDNRIVLQAQRKVRDQEIGGRVGWGSRLARLSGLSDEASE